MSIINHNVKELHSISDESAKNEELVVVLEV
jgi:hypothetical protein